MVSKSNPKARNTKAEKPSADKLAALVATASPNGHLHVQKAAPGIVYVMRTKDTEWEPCTGGEYAKYKQDARHGVQVAYFKSSALTDAQRQELLARHGAAHAGVAQGELTMLSARTDVGKSQVDGNGNLLAELPGYVYQIQATGNPDWWETVTFTKYNEARLNPQDFVVRWFHHDQHPDDLEVDLEPELAVTEPLRTTAGTSSPLSAGIITYGPDLLPGHQFESEAAFITWSKRVALQMVYACDSVLDLIRQPKAYEAQDERIKTPDDLAIVAVIRRPENVRLGRTLVAARDSLVGNMNLPLSAKTNLINSDKFRPSKLTPLGQAEVVWHMYHILAVVGSILRSPVCASDDHLYDVNLVQRTPVMSSVFKHLINWWPESVRVADVSADYLHSHYLEDAKSAPYGDHGALYLEEKHTLYHSLARLPVIDYPGRDATVVSDVCVDRHGKGFLRARSSLCHLGQLVIHRSQSLMLQPGTEDGNKHTRLDVMLATILAALAPKRVKKNMTDMFAELDTLDDVLCFAEDEHPRFVMQRNINRDEQAMLDMVLAALTGRK